MTEAVQKEAGAGVLASLTTSASAALAAAWGTFIASITSWPKVAGAAILALGVLAYMGKISAPSVPYVASKSDIAEIRAEMTQTSGKATAASVWYGALRAELEELRERVESLEAAKGSKPVKKPVARLKPVSTE